MNDGTDRVLLGTIGAPHGVKGAVRIRTFTAEPEAIAGYGALSDDKGETFEITECRPDKAGVIARIRGVTDRSAAESLKGKDLYVARSVLPEPDEDEFYHSDLIGLAATGTDGQPIGTVKAVLDYGAGEFLEIVPPAGRALLVPFTNAAVPVIDIDAGRIVVDPPPETEARPEKPPEKEE